MSDLVLLPVGDSSVASARYRVLAHRPALDLAGYSTRLIWPVRSGFLPGRLARVADLLRDVRGFPSAKLVFVHRKMYSPPLPRILFRRRPYVLDLDDALDLPPPGKPAHPGLLARYRRNFTATARSARFVVCGNEELQRRLPPGCESAVIPTPVDCSKFSPERIERASEPILGWVGHSDNFSYLQSLREPIVELRQRFPELSLHVVADRKPDLPDVPMTFRTWKLEEEVECFSGISVGLMPLDDTPWARSKCAFKLLQYMALGIPAVASPVGMNRDVICPGVDGVLASSPSEWVEAVTRLLSDPGFCASIAAEGRKKVLRQFHLPEISSQLIATLNQIRSDPGPVRSGRDSRLLV